MSAPDRSGPSAAGGGAGDTDAVERAVERAVDIAVLEAFAADVDDPAIVAAVVDAYLEQLPLRRAAVVDASARGDLVALADLGHTLRASSAMLGALRLAELAEDLERAARTGHLDGAQGAGAPLVGECDAVDSVLRAWRRR